MLRKQRRQQRAPQPQLSNKVSRNSKIWRQENAIRNWRISMASKMFKAQRYYGKMASNLLNKSANVKFKICCKDVWSLVRRNLSRKTLRYMNSMSGYAQIRESGRITWIGAWLSSSQRSQKHCQYTRRISAGMCTLRVKGKS